MIQKQTINQILKIITLVLVLVLILKINAVIALIPKAQEQNKDKIIQQTTNTHEVDTWRMKAEVIKDALNKKSEFVALEGTREIRCEYPITKNEVQWNTKSNIIGFLKDRLNELKTKTLIIQTTYMYQFVYDLKDLNMQIDGNKVYIKLQQSNVKVKMPAEDDTKRIMYGETNILSGSFTPYEISQLMKTTTIHTYNQLIHENEYYYKAMESTKEWLEKFLKELGLNLILRLRNLVN